MNPKRIVTIAALSLALAVASSRADNAPYWQQQVDYTIAVTLSRDGRTITGSESFQYHNNSPDTLRELYLKAFPNSARAASLMDLRARQFDDFSIARSDSSQWGSLQIIEVTDGHGDTLTPELDDTIYKLFLSRPIPPGGVAEFRLRFVTRLPVGIGDRHEYVDGQSKAAYWYPQVCVYDRKLGWVNSAYIGRGENYGDFGDYSLSITVPEDRVVIATGVLKNRAEVLPDSLRQLLDLRNFIEDKTSWPTFTWDSSATKTWRFEAKNVNDVAWVAGKDFCIDEGEKDSVKIEVYAKRSKAVAWQSAVRHAAEAIETFGDVCAPHAWPVVKVTDSYDGMEYPMLTFCGGGAPSKRFPLLLYHEIGHFWFMGQVGSNQVDRAFLDEGFTTNIEIIAMEKYLGRRGNIDNYDSSWFKRTFYPPDEDRDDRGLRPYLTWARADYDLPMIVSADNANEYMAYRVSSYYKPVAMHFALRAIYGDSAYFDALRTYTHAWMFKHPYEDDFVRSFSASVDENLDEYFAQWLTSRREIDYAFAGKKHVVGDTFLVTLSRPGDFVTPVDVAVITGAGDTLRYTINPEGHDFVKKGCFATPVWPQYRQPSFRHTFIAVAPGGIRKVQVDPSHELADVNRLNNASGFPPIETRIDALFHDVPSLHSYSLRLRPDMWHDQPNGLTPGVHAHGSFINTSYQFSMDLGYGAESKKILYDGRFSHPLSGLGRSTAFESRALFFNQVRMFSGGIHKEIRPRWTGQDYWTLDASLNTLDFSEPDGVKEFSYDRIFSGPPLSWADLCIGHQSTNRIVNVDIEAHMAKAGRVTKAQHDGFTQLSSRASFDIHLGGNLQLETGVENFMTSYGGAPESHLFHITRSQPIESFARHRMTRAVGSFPTEWADDVHLDNFGVPGYQNRELYGTRGFSRRTILRGLEVWRILPFEKIPLLGKQLDLITTEFFHAAGTIKQSYGTTTRAYQFETSSEGQSSPMYSSAGLSLVTPSLWRGQRLRFDFPFYLSQPLPGEENWDVRVSAAIMTP